MARKKKYFDSLDTWWSKISFHCRLAIKATEDRRLWRNRIIDPVVVYTAAAVRRSFKGNQSTFASITNILLTERVL